MKSFKCLLALPLMVTSLTACGGNNQFAKSDYAKVSAIVENYATSVKNSKAAGIEVSGHINKINIKGDATWWSAELPDDIEAGFKDSLISMIPNFSLKDGEINIDPQDIATFSLPASLTSVAETFINLRKEKQGTELSTQLLVLSNLPKFPMNNHLLQLLNGFKEIKYKDDRTIDWDNLEQEDWEYATVKYFSNAGRIKVSMETEDIETFMWEINQRIGEKEDKPEVEKAYPGSISLTTSKLGYIDSLSAKLSFKEEEFEEQKGDIFYVYLNGDIDIDLSLKFKQTISDPVTVKYQVTEYHKTGIKEGKPEPIDNTYTYFTDDTLTTTETISLTKDKTTPITTSLSDLSDYVTFDWMSNIETKDDKETGETIRTLTKVLDDPIFGYNYWKEEGRENIAFLNQAYDMVVLPAIDSTTKAATYQILGAEPHGYASEQLCPSLNSVSVDGRLVSDSNGIPRSTAKILVSSADVMMKGVNVTIDSKKSKYDLNELFINSNVLESRKSECVINISVMKLAA